MRQIHALIVATESDVKKRTRKLRADLKIVKMLAMVFGIFYISYLPLSFTVAITWLTKSDGTETFVVVLRNLSSRLVYLNSLINPFIYAWKDRRFRICLKHLFMCKQLPPGSLSTDHRVSDMNTNNSITK